MCDAKQRYYIVFNGEIFNFIELRAELQQLNHTFSTETDTEVILAAYLQWGSAMLHKFNGMWAMAIYDTHSNDLFLARDRFGIKPLYYHTDKNRIVWASEVQAIHQLLGSTHKLCKEAIVDISSGSFDTHGSNKTYLEDVYNLPGGYCLSIKGGSQTPVVEQWYQLKQINVPSSLELQAQKLKILLLDACKLRLRSDVPIATCLSGGLDSGSITSIINSINEEQNSADAKYSENYTHKGFCAAFDGTPIDESEAAQKLAQQLDTQIDVLQIDAPSPVELEQAMADCDGPMHALAFYPIWKLYQHIKKAGITVTLDGQGPDEMLGGYSPVTEALESALMLKDWIWFSEIVEAYSHQGESSQMSAQFIVKQTKNLVIKHHLQKILKWPRLKAGNMLREMGVLRPYIPPPAPNNLLPPAIATPDFIQTPIDKSLFRQFFYNPLPGILQQYDRCSMAHGVECRMPFMDYRIVEFVFSLPPQSKIGGGYTKQVLRKAVEGILPDFIRLNRTKIGFNAPIVDWFRGPLREWMLVQVNDETFLKNPYFDGQTIRDKFVTFIDSGNMSWNEAWGFWPPVHLNWWMKKQQIQKH
jgi:asparagine synthase (glutamine-hydrolysing)